MLETVWFLLWGILWAIYFVLDGFDLGIGTISPLLGKTEENRKAIYASMAPFWDGNEVWLITAGGVTFAAFPSTYAVMFSALYTPLMLLLFALILRAVAFEFRDKLASPPWKTLWDKVLFLGSFLPALLLGVAFSNLFRGIPLDREGIFQGNLFTLLNPYGLLGGVLFVLFFAHHGALWLCIRAGGALQAQAADLAGRLWIALLLAAALFLGVTAAATRLYENYLSYPALFLLPAGAVASLIFSRANLGKERWWRAWAFSGAAIALATLFGVVGIYPALIPSSLDAAYSLTIYNSASSPFTLRIMLAVALVFVPIVIIYQAWAYRVFATRMPPEGMPPSEVY